MAGRRAASDLTTKQIENLTNLMLDKLARFAYMRDPKLTPGEITRDEVRMVVVDTAILCTSEDPAATLEKWMSE